MVKMIGWLMMVLLFQQQGAAQSKWSGGAGDGLWKTPANWMSGIAPKVLPSEDVLLDNSLYPGDYIVRITALDSMVIHSLTIAPAEGRSITVIIDSLSTVSIALTVTSNEQGIVISKGGGIINASGAADGAIISLTDSLRIENGGFYSHQTRRAHAALVTRLCRRPGTEKGVFEFNLPTASNTLSLSNQHYGTLRLSSLKYGNNCTYSGGATNPLNIRGDLEIGARVTFSLNFDDTVFIKGNYLQAGGSFNIANSTRASTVCIYGDLLQNGGVITKTGTAAPGLVLSGSTIQQVNFTGGITGNVSMKVNNQAGIQLVSSLAIPFLLELSKGRISTSISNLLIITAGGKIVADSTSDVSFIDGPVKKLGLSAAQSFLFPVGKNGVHRWVCLKNASGNFTVEYHRSDPRSVSNVLQPGLDHISSLEYWSVAADASPVASARVSLSYDENSSGGVTDLATLRVAAFTNGSFWSNGGNEATTGSAGSSGSVQSGLFSGIINSNLYTLAGSTRMQNPLPLTLISFNAIRKKDYVSLSWRIGTEYLAGHFVLEGSQNGSMFGGITNMRATAGLSEYEYNDRQVFPSSFYRLKVTDKWGKSFYSRVIQVGEGPEQWQFDAARITAGNVLECTLQSEKAKPVRLELFDMSARRLMFLHHELVQGNNTLRFSNVRLPEGNYILRVWDKEKAFKTLRFIK